MQYTEEHYAKLYNELPEGLKDLVLSGRLAILVSAIGSRHGLSADQVADLEPAIEDVCLGLITADELVENIIKNVNVDQRVANRIAAEAELEIMKPFTSELVIARKQKEDLDKEIMKENGPKRIPTQLNGSAPVTEPKDVTQHQAGPVQAQKAVEYFTQNNNTQGTRDTKPNEVVKSFDWESDFAKKKEAQAATTTPDPTVPSSIENKLNELTDTINKLVNSRFGEDKKDTGVSDQMQELLKRLEKAEKENEENKKLIKNLQNNNSQGKPLQNIFGVTAPAKEDTKIQIDKQRKVEIDHKEKKGEPATGNIQITSTKQNPLNDVVQAAQAATPAPVKEQEIASSTVSKDTLDSIVEIRNKTTSNTLSDNLSQQTSSKKGLDLNELVKGDDKIKTGLKPDAVTKTMTFPGLSEEKKIEIKDVSQKSNLKQILLDDIEFLKTGGAAKKEETKDEAPKTPTSTGTAAVTAPAEEVPVQEEQPEDVSQPTTLASASDRTYATNPFKDELIPKTKEERMKALQDKIKALNKGVSVGGSTNISASGLDPYKI